VRVIIAGSRGIDDPARLNRGIIAAQFDITRVVSGCAAGVDKMGEAWAKLQDPVVPVDPFPADWDKLGKRAGMVRNCAMAKNADALIALWDGHSNGTRHMIQEAVGAGLYHYIDPACPHCGRNTDVALYMFHAADVKFDELRAVCRPCLMKRLGDASFGPEALAMFDVFRMWGRHELHTTLPRVKKSEVPLPLPPRAEVKGLVFGQKPPKERKSVKKLPTYNTARTLFTT
jgi:hypothetical protein